MSVYDEGRLKQNKVYIRKRKQDGKQRR